MFGDASNPIQFVRVSLYFTNPVNQRSDQVSFRYRDGQLTATAKVTSLESLNLVLQSPTVFFQQHTKSSPTAPYIHNAVKVIQMTGDSTGQGDSLCRIIKAYTETNHHRLKEIVWKRFDNRSQAEFNNFFDISHECKFQIILIGSLLDG